MKYKIEAVNGTLRETLTTGGKEYLRELNGSGEKVFGDMLKAGGADQVTAEKISGILDRSSFMRDVFELAGCCDTEKTDENHVRKADPGAVRMMKPGKWTEYEWAYDGGPAIAWECDNCGEVVGCRYKFCPECGDNKIPVPAVYILLNKAHMKKKGQNGI